MSFGYGMGVDPDDATRWTCKHCGGHTILEGDAFPIDVCADCESPVYAESEAHKLDTSDDDVLLDHRYVSFNPIKAFRLLRKLRCLDECLDEYDERDE